MVGKHKAQEAYSKLKVPVIVDDVGLSVNAMGKLPGPFIKYFIEELDRQGICDLVSVYKDKTATATVAICYCDGKRTEIFLGSIKGSISKKSKGDGGFGWDQIFVPEGYRQTRGQMNEKDYDATSPRKMALEKFEKFLKKQK